MNDYVFSSKRDNKHASSHMNRLNKYNRMKVSVQYVEVEELSQ